MKIKREKFLNDLNAVKAGLSSKEFLEQSTSIVLQEEGTIVTFNDEVCCRKSTSLKGVSGAVHAQTLYEIIERMDDEFLEVRESDGELEFAGKRKAFGVVKEKEIHLPIDRVEMPKAWRELPKEFAEAVQLVKHCVGTDENQFLLTCIHINADMIEACDNYQMMRCTVKTGLDRSVLVRGASLASIVPFAMESISLTKSWIHFKNSDGLMYSCRRYTEDYPSLESLLALKGHSIVIPRGLADASERAAVFGSEKTTTPMISVHLRQGKLKLKGENLMGWYREVRKVDYSGPEMEFVISASLLKHVSENYSDAKIGDDKLKVSGGQWEYVTALGKKVEEDANDDAEKTEKKK